MLAIIVVNYRQTSVTLDCLRSLYQNTTIPFQLFLVDNAADANSTTLLHAYLATQANTTLISNPDNKGFATACNQAIERILIQGNCRGIALLNNDAIPEANWLARLANSLNDAEKIGMVASRMMRDEARHCVDSLGIVLYKSGIASNRKSVADPLLGPCGGAALYSTAMLKVIKETTGCIFDDYFFCYAEDTDLALRARALGYVCAFVDDAVVYHKGSVSAKRMDSAFIAYHGLRNSLFAMIKNLPAAFFWYYAPWILLMQGAVMIKYFVKGRGGLPWRVYHEVWLRWDEMLSQRRELRRAEKLAWRDWRPLICQKLYDYRYIKHSLLTLHQRSILLWFMLLLFTV